MHVNLPPMGWNSWNTFGSEINEKVVMESADVLAESGLRDAGYNYLVIDDHWHLKERGADGRMVPDPEKFPHGMKYVADYIHSKGLKFGMYTCSGYLTCGGHPGSYDNEWLDAQTFAEWEVDFLKYDFCFYPKTVRSDIFYKRIRLALSNCGRDILFSACTAGLNNSKQWIREAAPDMWRSSADINDSWQSIRETAEGQLMAQEYNVKGSFNDMDMLVVGMNGKGNVGFKGCTTEEYKTHFSLWALLNSPLMIGCDIREMDDAAKAILMNRDVIAVNQDPKCSLPFFANNFIWKANQARKSDSEPHFEKYPLDVPIIAKYLDNGDIAVGVFNFMDEAATRWQMTLTCDNLGLPLNCGKTFEAHDLWTGETVRPFNGTLMIDHLEPHACRLFRLKIVDKE
ncbi:MAG: glycoside hydrolase family 27 protein [Clostridia bacterium]|nr:glycoside hydrolase family 27 protein [Clostridia bacterium]